MWRPVLITNLLVEQTGCEEIAMNLNTLNQNQFAHVLADQSHQATQITPERSRFSSRVLTGSRFWFRKFADRRNAQRALIPLLQQRDIILRDLGYERTDIKMALKLPLEFDALRYMEQKRTTRND